MCFSAPASFVASGVLAGIGGASMKIAKGRDRFVAAIPFIFGIQQALEGIVWLLPEGNIWRLGAAYGFLFFAFLFWPVYIPLVFRSLESNVHRKKAMLVFVAVGLFVALFLLVNLLLESISIRIEGGHIVYALLSGTQFVVPIVIAYVFAVCGSLLSSSHHLMRWIGVCLFLFAGISALSSLVAFTSVWCFFSAILSCLLYGYLWQKRTK